MTVVGDDFITVPDGLAELSANQIELGYAPIGITPPDVPKKDAVAKLVKVANPKSTNAALSPASRRKNGWRNPEQEKKE